MQDNPISKTQRARKRILIFSLSYYPLVGGAEVAIKELTDRITDIEFDMVTRRLDSNQASFERVGNVNVYRIGSGSSYLNKILFVPRAAMKALKLDKAKKYDLLWAMMTNMAFPISLMRLARNHTPYVLTLQDGDPFERVFERLRIRLFKPLLVQGFKNAVMIQAISYFLADWATHLGYEGSVVVVPNGVDVSLFSRAFTPPELEEAKQKIGKEAGDIILASSSRLVEKNGLDYVIQALPLLPENVKFFNWGVGPDKNKLEKLASDLGVSARVRLFDHDPIRLPIDFRVSDIFIRPSLSEGQGISFLEGMAAELPIIGTAVGGIPDFLFDPENSEKATGLFVQPRDSQSIASAVKKLISEPDLRSVLVRNALELVRERYDWKLISKRMKEEVFDPVMQDR
jgi:glycosyltransferase involved in cell wall biosynthesis